MTTGEETVKLLKSIDAKLGKLLQRFETPEEKAQREANVKGWADAARSQDSLAVSATTAEPMTVTVAVEKPEEKPVEPESIKLTAEQMASFAGFKR